MHILKCIESQHSKTSPKMAPCNAMTFLSGDLNCASHISLQPRLTCDISFVYHHHLGMNSQISHTISACSYHLRTINHISRYLPTTTKERVTNALITSRIDYCHPLPYRVFNGFTTRQRGLFCVVPELTGPRHFNTNCIGFQSHVRFSTIFLFTAWYRPNCVFFLYI